MSFQFRMPLVRPLTIPVERLGWRGSRIRMRSSGVGGGGAVAVMSAFSCSGCAQRRNPSEESPPESGRRAEGAGVWVPGGAGSTVRLANRGSEARMRLAAAPLAFGDIDVVGAHVVGGLEALAPGGHVQLQQGAGADGAGHVEVEAGRLVDMALAARVLAHRGELVDAVAALLVIGPGVQRQAGGSDRAAIVLLFLVVER